MVQRRHDDQLGLELGQLVGVDFGDAHSFDRHLAFAAEDGHVDGAEPAHKVAGREKRVSSEK